MPGEPVDAHRVLRGDAQANQERVLAAAVTVFLREGRQVPMATIAAEAGVGVATLYRRYPNRGALLADLTRRAFGLLAELAESIDRGPGTGREKLAVWWDRVIDEHDQLVLPLGGGPALLDPPTQALQARLHTHLGGILAAGQADGTVRRDVTLDEIVLFGAMLVMPLPGVGDWPSAARRQARIHLDGLA